MPLKEMPKLRFAGWLLTRVPMPLCEYVTVGGASAGAITTVARYSVWCFRDEIAIDDDSTLSTTNLEENYNIKSIVYFWGSNIN